MPLVAAFAAENFLPDGPDATGPAYLIMIVDMYRVIRYICLLRDGLSYRLA